MRPALAILFFAVNGIASTALADGSFAVVAMGSHNGYIVPEDYATSHKADFAASMLDFVKIKGFWTPSETDVLVAERTFRELIQRGGTDLSQVYPNMVKHPTDYPADSIKQTQNDLVLVSKNYDAYTRQFVGLVIDDRKEIFCNYSDFQKVDPSIEYIFIQKVFLPDCGLHFLQCRYDMESKTCSHVSIVGSWQPGAH